MGRQPAITYKANSRPYGLPSSGARPFGQSERFRPAMSAAPFKGDLGQPQLGPYDTPLSQQEEMLFQAWKAKHAPRDSGEDYDLRGAFKEGLAPDPQSGHWPDTYKKPNHPTFSTQSKYAAAAPELAGAWDANGRYLETAAHRWHVATGRAGDPNTEEGVTTGASPPMKRKQPVKAPVKTAPIKRITNAF